MIFYHSVIVHIIKARFYVRGCMSADIPDWSPSHFENAAALSQHQPPCVSLPYVARVHHVHFRVAWPNKFVPSPQRNYSSSKWHMKYRAVLNER